MKIRNVISPSSLTDLATCRQKWAWSRTYSRIKRSEYFELGTGIHLALERHYRGLRDGIDISMIDTFTEWAMEQIDNCKDPEDRKTMNKVRVKGISMIEGYTRRYPSSKEVFDVIELEHTIRRPIPGTDWEAEVRIDGIIRHKPSKTYWGLENKTFSTFHEGYLYIAHQFVMEAWVADYWAKNELGVRIGGVLYNGLRSQIDSPKVKSALFERMWLDMTDTQIRTLRKRLKDTVAMLSSGHMAIYPEPNEIQCNMCQFKEVCQAKLREEDYEYMLRTMFTEYDHPEHGHGAK